jgi:cell division septation protein DedD
MAEQGYHEIQLSGKQLVFLFMSAVVLAIVIFLLGVSVGRAVRRAAPPTLASDQVPAVGAPGDTTVPAGTPTTTKVPPSDLTYHDMLQGGSAAKPGTLPTEPPPAPAGGAKPAPTPPSRSAAAATSTQSAATSTKPASSPARQAQAKTQPPRTQPPKTPAAPPPAKSPTATTRPAAPQADGWIVQLGAFSTKANAQRLVDQLKGKGFTAFIQDAVPPSRLFKVRIGPFSDRADAAQLADRLKKAGFQSSITR